MASVSSEKIIEVVRKRPGITTEELFTKFSRANENQVLLALENALGLVYRDGPTGEFVTSGKAERKIRQGNRRIYLSREGPVEQQLDQDGNIRLVIRTKDEGENNPIIDRGVADIASMGEEVGIGTYKRLLKKLTRS